MDKHCSGCGNDKPISEFYKKANKYTSIGGYSFQCKTCTKRARAEYVKNNPDKQKNSDRTYRLNKYNLSVGQYNDMFTAQEGRCLGCTRHQSEFDRRLAVDHDHTTGKVRGLLCMPCNLILGYARDQASALSNLIDYLNTPKTELAEQSNIVSITAGVKKAG